jgi:hypothetical protein
MIMPTISTDIQRIRRLVRLSLKFENAILSHSHSVDPSRSDVRSVLSFETIPIRAQNQSQINMSRSLLPRV